MKNKIKIQSYILSFIIIFLYSYMFYKNLLISVILSLIISMKFYKIFYEIIYKKEEIKMKIYFREFLDILNSAVLGGRNLLNALKYTRLEMKKYLVNQDEFNRGLSDVISEIENGKKLGEALYGLKSSLNIEEASTFVDSLIVSIDSGIDLGKLISNCKDSINAKISVGLEIDKIIQNSRREFIIMIILPILVLLSLNFTMAVDLKFIDYIVRTPIFISLIFSLFLGHKIVNMEI